MASSDLKQVSALFEACISQIRSKPPQNLEKEAEEYIKSARVAVMKDIETHFKELASKADTPDLVPYWAIDPSTPLTIFTPEHSRQLDPYILTFESEFEKLMEECGFNATVIADTLNSRRATGYFISITFPTTVPQNATTKYFTKCFTSLPKFSAAVLKITQGVEEPAAPEPDSFSVKREVHRPTTRRSAGKSARSASTAGRTLRRSQGVKEARDKNSEDGPASATRTSKRLRSSASVPNAPEEHPDEVVTQRRSKRLRGL